MEAHRLRRDPIKVVLDANALMMPFQFGLNLEGELDRLLGVWAPLVPGTVVRELARLAEKNKRDSPAARAALELVRNKGYKIEEVRGHGDQAIAQWVKGKNVVVVTNDRELRHKLRAEGITVIYMRSTSLLEVEGRVKEG